MKQAIFQKRALRALRKMPVQTAKYIKSKIDAYASDPASQANNVKALQGRPGIRLRVGDYRVIMLDGEVLDIIDIGPLGSIYWEATWKPSPSNAPNTTASGKRRKCSMT